MSMSPKVVREGVTTSSGWGGDDIVRAFQDDDPDQDIVRLGSGGDFGNTQDGDGEDTIRGGDGQDFCFFDPTDTVISCRQQ
jgi:hypothetical protein